MAKNVQVFPNGPGKWGVKIVGDQESPTKDFESKDQAVAEGKRLAEQEGGQLLVHDEAGLTEQKEQHAG